MASEAHLAGQSWYTGWSC